MLKVAWLLSRRKRFWPVNVLLILSITEKLFEVCKNIYTDAQKNCLEQKIHHQCLEPNICHQ